MNAFNKTLLITFLSASSFAQTDTAFYSVVNKEKITGSQKIWRSANKEIFSVFQFNDRGRGDSLASKIVTDKDGLINQVEVLGLDYYKNPYSEKFFVKNDSVIWVVNGERKAKKLNNELYSVNSGPALFEIFINRIITQPGKRVDLVQGGSVHIDEAIEKEITLNKKTLKLKLFPVYFEPSPSPMYVWMTGDMHFFAFVSAWTSTILKGYEKLSDSLFIYQEIASQKYYTGELQANSKKLTSNILFAHCNIFHSDSATVQKDMSVHVVDGKIESIFSSRLNKKIKTDSVIDCKGKFLMPGLWDMHGHYAKEEGGVYLAGGVTHLRDMGNDKILLTYKKQIADNKLLGPDISYISGFIDREDPFQAPTGKIIKTLPEGINAIDEYHKLGYQQIKLYSAIKPEWVKPLAKHAHELGMKVCGHIPAFMTAEQAINDGYDEMTHMNFIFLNFMGDTIDTRTPARFRLVGDNAGKLDLQSERVKKFVALMKSKNVVLDPSMNVWQGMFDEFKGDTNNYIKPVVKWLPESMLAELEIKAPFGSEENKTAYKASFKNMMKMLKLLYDNNIMLVAGTDGGEANGLHHELELYVQAGIPANQVLKIATYNAASDCNLTAKYGLIKAGRQADFILIDGNPIENISDIRRVELVIKNNRLYSPKQILALQGWKYYY